MKIKTYKKLKLAKEILSNLLSKKEFVTPLGVKNALRAVKSALKEHDKMSRNTKKARKNYKTALK